MRIVIQDINDGYEVIVTNNDNTSEFVCKTPKAVINLLRLTFGMQKLGRPPKQKHETALPF